MKRLGNGAPGKVGRAVTAGRRAWPVVVMAWERWQSLSPEEKERYRRRARTAVDHGRKTYERRKAEGPALRPWKR